MSGTSFYGSNEPTNIRGAYVIVLYKSTFTYILTYFGMQSSVISFICADIWIVLLEHDVMSCSVQVDSNSLVKAVRQSCSYAALSEGRVICGVVL